MGAIFLFPRAQPMPDNSFMEPAVRAALQNASETLRNAKKLGGPKTPEGKSRSAMNALRHGLSASNLLLPGEDAQEYERHLDGYFTTFAQAAYEHLGNMAKVARGALTAKLAQEEAALEPVRERLAAAVLLLEDADLRKLERHRRLLESSMARQLGLLGPMRVQVAASRPEAQAEAQELRVRLRVVK